MQGNRIGYLRAYLAFWKNAFDFSSRTSREAFWKAYFVNSLILFIMMLPVLRIMEDLMERGDISGLPLLMPLSFYSVIMIIPTIAVMLRRLHDIDRHGCFVLLFILVPAVGTIVMFIMLSRKSAPYDTYPGRSGSGPYKGQDGAPPQNPYAAPPQYPYGAPPQNPYAAPPHYPYGAPPQAPYAAPPQYPYGAPPQAPYAAPPQNPYAAPPQYPYGAPPVYYRPLPPPREFAPKAGGNNAMIAIILSIVVAVGSNVFSLALNDYMQKNIDRFVSSMIGNMIPDYFGDFFDEPYYWEGSDPWSENDPWNENIPWDDEEFWESFPDFEQNRKDQFTEDEQAAVNLVRESTLEGFPEYTIEEVLLSRVEEDSLMWECFSEEGGGSPDYYVSSSGYIVGDFLVIYTGFDVYEDGTVELFNIDDGERDEYYGEALELYRAWYDEMMLDAGNTSSL